MVKYCALRDRVLEAAYSINPGRSQRGYQLEMVDGGRLTKMIKASPGAVLCGETWKLGWAEGELQGKIL